MNNNNLPVKGGNPQILIDEWVKREMQGERFPVDFDVAWQLAGYSRKSVAKRRLSHFKEGLDFCTEKCKTSPAGRFSDSIRLSCDTLKHFCLLAETEQGHQIRQYFIEAEKKWRIVQQQYPAIASEVEKASEEMELLKLKNQNLKLESKIKATELELLQFRHVVTTTCPEPVQQKILGYQTIERIEYRDRIIDRNKILRDGSTINKTELCHRYKLLTRTGKPDYSKLNQYLETIPDEAFDDVPAIRDNRELKREYLEVLDREVLGSDRQLFLGE